MDASRIISALDSKLRIEILKILAEKPNNVVGVLQKLRSKGLDARYRETVYRGLEKLADAELVEKYYDKESGLCYKLTSDRFKIEIRRESVSIGT